MSLRTRWLSLAILQYLIVVSSVSVGTRSGQSALFKASCKLQRRPFIIPRGGSTTLDDEDEDERPEEEEEAEEEVDNDEEDGDDEENPLNKVISSEPLKVTVKTNLGSALIDTSIELLVSRSRNVGSVKKSCSKQLQGRPPIPTQRLYFDGRELQDDVLIDELVDEEEEEDETDNKKLTLVLDMIPPVESKFNIDKERIEKLSTEELLAAYTLNEAALSENSELMHGKAHHVEGPLYVKLRQDALDMRQLLLDSIFSSPEEAEKVIQKDSTQTAHELALEPRGQLRRTGRGGAKQNFKRVMQKNLNINWPDTIRNFLLCIFFGVFGGRNSVSKYILLLWAPMCFVIQARPVKVLIKQAFHLFKNPPLLLLGVLPVPQQAILSFDEDAARRELYGGPPREEDVEQTEDEETADDEDDGEEFDVEEYDEMDDEYDEED